MEIALIRETYNKSILRFEADLVDAEPPVWEVFFEGEKLGRVDDQRWAVIAFIMVRELVGNSISFAGFSAPPHLAVAFQKHAELSELFVSPIDNDPRRILPKEDVEDVTLVFGEDERPNRFGKLVVTEHELGFRFSLLGSEDCYAQTIKTNLRLWAALSSSQVEISMRTIIALIASDVYGVRRCSIGLSEGADRDFPERLESLCREVGVSVD